MSFPVSLAPRQDVKYFSEAEIDNTIKGELDGGYMHTRPRTTRPPRTQFATGFSDLSDAEKVTLQTFFKSRGTHTSFVYAHPVSLSNFVVRFDSAPKYNYVGMNGNHRWNVPEIVLTEV